jgi:5-(carboxyamino)imidazole ribonucleotide mutase
MSVKVAIIMGSESDWQIMKDADKALSEFGIKTIVEIVSAHRTPDKMKSFVKKAESNGIQVIIAGAGGAAHLPGMIASLTYLPVIGIPVKLKHLNGLDSLLSIVQMPKGVPVATMAIDNAYNGGLLAARIIGIQSKPLKQKLKTYQKNLKLKVDKMNQNIKSILKD